MNNDVVIMTACDQRYYPLCVDLIASIKGACGFMPRMRVLDVGMLPSQIAELAAIVETVTQPGWDVGEGMKLPTRYRAMTARPFLPKYAGDAVVIAWIDSDAWIQRYEPVQSLINAARHGQLAIVEERYGSGFSVNVIDQQGMLQTIGYNSSSIRANIRNCYDKCFGSDVAGKFADLPPFNSGVFALRAESPSWAIWQETFTPALARHFHFLAEQSALNVAIRQGLIPVSEQPQDANYTCHQELPWYSADSGVLTFPRDAGHPLGVVHLCDTKNYSNLPIPQSPHGLPQPMSLWYRSIQKKRVSANAQNWGAVRRNTPCPCGSGRKYKHCHGAYT